MAHNDIFDEPTELKPWQAKLAQFMGSVLARGMLTFAHILGMATKPILLPYVKKLQAIEAMPEDVKAILNKIVTSDGEWQAMLLGGIAGTAVGGASSAALLPPLEKLKQFVSSKDPFQLLPLRDALQARLRGTITQDQLNEVLNKTGFHDWQFPILQELSQTRLDPAHTKDAWLRDKEKHAGLWQELADQGLSENRIEILKELAYTRLDPMTVAQVWLRDKDKYAKYWKDLADQGISEDRIEVFKELAKVIPPLPDMVRFADYSGFDPEVIEAWKEYYTAPDWIRQPFALIGVEEDWANKYWFSHWRQPGRYELEEMLHRGIIDDDAVRLAYKTMGYSAYWQDNMLERSYTPFTRVDVRRMHKLGILSEDELQQAYQDIGFNAEKAAGMVEFTLKYNADPVTSDQTDNDKTIARERDLTKTDILNGYRDGLLSVDEAKTPLVLMGYSEEEANYYIARVNYFLERDEIDLMLSFYHDAFIKNISSELDIIDKLGKLNLPAGQTDKLMAYWKLEKEVKVNRPTKAELLGFLRRDIIDIETCRDELKGHGYSDRYIDWYLQGV